MNNNLTALDDSAVSTCVISFSATQGEVPSHAHEISSFADCLLFKDNPHITKTENVLSFAHALAISKNMIVQPKNTLKSTASLQTPPVKQMKGKLKVISNAYADMYYKREEYVHPVQDTISSQGSSLVTHHVYIGRKLNAFFKHRTARWPFHVIGYYNGEIVLSTFKRVETRGIINELKTKAYATISRSINLGKIKENLQTSLGNTQIKFGKVSTALGSNAILSDAFTTLTLFIHNKKLIDLEDSVKTKGDLSYHIKGDNVYDLKENIESLADTSYFTVGPFIGDNFALSDVPNIQYRVKDSFALVSGAVTSNADFRYSAHQLTTNRTDIIKTFGDLSISPILYVPNKHHELMTRANINLVAIDNVINLETQSVSSKLGKATIANGLVHNLTQTHEIVTNFYTSKFIIDQMVRDLTNKIASHAQADLQAGSNVSINRTESITSKHFLTTSAIQSPGLQNNTLGSLADLQIQRDTPAQSLNKATSNADTVYESIKPVIITLNKQSGVGGTETITTLKGMSIVPSSISVPTRAHYNLMGYYDQLFTGERQHISFSTPQVLSTGVRYTMEGDVFTGSRMNFLKNLYANSIYWRLHVVIKSKKPVTAISLSTFSVIHDLIDVSIGEDYIYILDTSFTDEICNNTVGGHAQYMTVKTTDDANAQISLIDRWAYVSPTPIIQRISSEGDLLQLTNNTFLDNKTLYAQWASDKAHIYWRSYSSVIIRWSIVCYEGYSDVTPTVVYATTGTPNTAQYTYTWSRDSYSITSEMESGGMVVITEKRTVNSYTITWRDYYGEVLKEETLEYGSTSNAPVGSTNTVHYSYAWPKASTTVGAHEVINETRTINTYTVTWVNYAGEVVKVDTFNYGKFSLAPANTPNTVEHIYSWPQTTVPTNSNQTIIETRTSVIYTIKFINYANTVVSTQYLKYNQKPIAPSNTENTVQYTYTWPSVSNVTGSINYQEIRTTNQYTITWITYEGVTAKTETLDYGSVSVAPIGTPDNEYWDYDWPGLVTVLGDASVNEIRVGQAYQISFNANGGGTPSVLTRTIRYGNNYSTLPTSTWDKHKLLGWFTSSVGGTKITAASTMLTPSNHTLYAHWDTTEILSNVSHPLTSFVASDMAVGSIIQINRTELLSSSASLEYKNQTVFHITLDPASGTGGTTEIYGSTGISIIPTVVTPPTRTNHIFDGYYSSDGTKYINADGTFNGLDTNTFIGNVVLQAQWTVAQVQFVFELIPSTIGTTGDIYFDGVRTHNNVVGKTLSQTANALFKINDLKYPSGWTYKEYTTSALTNVLVGGSGSTTEVQGVGDINNPNARLISMTAEGIVYAINLQKNSGVGTSISHSTYQPSTSSKNVTLTRGSRANYRFGRWTVTGGNNMVLVDNNVLNIPVYTKTVKPFGDITITANWLPATASATDTVSSQAGCEMFESNVITITLDKQTGVGGTSSIASVLNFYLDPTTIVIPTKVGYSFTGYYTSTSGGTKRIDATGLYVNLYNYTYIANTTLYARWSLNTYTLTHDRNGGTGGNASTTYDYHTVATLISVLGEPTKVGYTHIGYKWISTSVGTWAKNNIYDQQHELNKDYGSGTLQSQWQANQYVLTLNHNIGVGSTTTNVLVTYGDTYGTLMTPTRTGYAFLGWYTSAVGGTKIKTTTVVSTAADHTFYAHWKPVTVTQALVNSTATNATSVLKLGKALQINYTSTVLSKFIISTSAHQNFLATGTQSMTTKAYLGFEQQLVLSYNQTITTKAASDMRAGHVIQINRNETVSSTLVSLIIPGKYSLVNRLESVQSTASSVVKASKLSSISKAESVSSTATLTYENQTAFRITLNKNGGTGGTSEISGLTGVSITPTSVSVPTKSGSTFQGYYTTRLAGTQRIRATGLYVSTATLRNLVGDVTLYAHWKADGGAGQL